MNALKSPVTRCDLPRGADNAEGRRGQVLDVGRSAALVEHLEREAAKRTQSLDGRRRERNHDTRSESRRAVRAAAEECSAADARRPAGRRTAFSLAKISPWFGALPAKLKPTTENTDSTSGVAIRMASRPLSCDVRGVSQRRPARRLHDRDEVAGVLLGHERLRHAGVDAVRGAEQAR